MGKKGFKLGLMLMGAVLLAGCGQSNEVMNDGESEQQIEYESQEAEEEQEIDLEMQEAELEEEASYTVGPAVNPRLDGKTIVREYGERLDYSEDRIEVRGARTELVLEKVDQVFAQLEESYKNTVGKDPVGFVNEGELFYYRENVDKNVILPIEAIEMELEFDGNSSSTKQEENWRITLQDTDEDGKLELNDQLKTIIQIIAPEIEMEVLATKMEEADQKVMDVLATGQESGYESTFLQYGDRDSGYYVDVLVSCEKYSNTKGSINIEIGEKFSQ